MMGFLHQAAGEVVAAGDEVNDFAVRIIACFRRDMADEIVGR